MVTLLRLDILALTIAVLVVVIIGMLIFPRLGWHKLRRVGAIEAFAESVRVCAEKGRPDLFSPGGMYFGSLYPQYMPAVMNLIKHVTKQAGAVGVRVLTTCAHPVTHMMALDYARQGYVESGHPELWSEENHFYLSYWTSMVLGIVGIIQRFNVGAIIMTGGHWWGTCMTIAEFGVRQGCYQVSGEVWPEENAECALAVDHVNIGEEIIAGGSYVSNDPVDQASLSAMDVFKFILIAILIGGSIAYATGVIAP